MTLLPPLTAPQHPLHHTGGVVRSRARDHDAGSALAAAAPSPPAAQPEQQHQDGPLRPNTRTMPHTYAHGEPPGSPRQHSFTGAAGAGLQRSNSASFSRRPSSAPRANGSGENSTTDADDDETGVVIRPPKPPLLRSQSEYASPHRDDAEQTDNEDFEWGARHGFEDHYQSEDIISQLANVSRSLLPSPPALVG